MGDLTSKFLIVVKGLLFLLIILVAGVILFIQNPGWLTALLLLLLAWASGRFYYFLFYVLEKYVDPELKYAGIGNLLVAILRRKRGAKQPDDQELLKEEQ